VILVDYSLIDSKATIDQLEDIEYILEVNERLGIRYNNPP
jgi:hypothetical protein